MEIDNKADSSVVPVETGEKKGGVHGDTATTTKANGPAAPNPVSVSSGLPRSEKELESLISTIQQTVTNNVLPRLHKCLTAKVECHGHARKPDPSC